MSAVDITLRQLDAWFNEPSQGGDRPKLISKLAVIELCGWLEGEFDRLAMTVDSGRLNDSAWVKQNIIDKTNGFTYQDHWRQMLVKLVGEIFARRVEDEMEMAHPGDLDRLKSLLGSLWRIRCQYAHADMGANVAAQQTFSAPSWTQNQYRILVKLLSKYENVLLSVISTI